MKFGPRKVTVSSRRASLAWLILAFSPLSLAAQEDIQWRLEKLRANYLSLSSIRFTAQLEIEIYQAPSGTRQEAPARRSEGEFEYSAQGDMYKIGASMGSALPNAPKMQTAFNGERYQVFMDTDAYLSFVDGDRDVPGYPPNVLFSPIEFLSKDDDECRGCIIKMRDIRDDELWTGLIERSRVVPEGHAGEDLIGVEVPGGILEGAEFVFRVYFPRTGVGLPEFLPVRVDRVREGGSVITSALIEKYEFVETSEGSLWLPAMVSVHSYNEQGGRLASFRASFQDVAVNTQLAEDAFTLDVAAAKIIWDGTRRIFLKIPGALGIVSPDFPPSKSNETLDLIDDLIGAVDSPLPPSVGTEAGEQVSSQPSLIGVGSVDGTRMSETSGSRRLIRWDYSLAAALVTALLVLAWSRITRRGKGRN